MEKQSLNIFERLAAIQAKLKAPKDQYNSFGKYKYRSAEGILEAVKPLLKELNCTLWITDDLVFVGDRYYIKATATIRNESGEHVSATAFAREAASKKSSDEAQITGLASSYARKYALGGLFCIDEGKDPDTMDNREEGTDPKASTREEGTNPKASTNPLEPASKTKERKLLREGDELWTRAIAYCRKNNLSAEALRMYCDISDADIKAMNNILSEE
jgi:hypothetical protein